MSRNNVNRVVFLVVSAALVLVPSVNACQECEVWQVSTLNGRIVDMYTGDPVSGATVRLRKATERKPGEERPDILACSATYKKGSVVYLGKTNQKGEYAPAKLKPGYYWLVVKGKDAQLVRLIFYEPEVSEQDSLNIVEYEASDSGYVSNMCDVEKTEDFL